MFSPAGVHDGLHLGQLPVHILGHGQLAPGPHQVVVRVVDIEVQVSHQVIVPETEDIQIDVPDANHIVIKGIDKQKVGQFAAEVRGKKPPEPYKGKGIKYDYEVIRRKEGKTGAK